SARPEMDVSALSAAQAAAAMRDGDLAAEAYAQALLERARRLERLNAFLTIDETGLLEAARAADRRRNAGQPLGPLHGVPLAIKDNIDVAGLPTTCDSPPLQGNLAPDDAETVRRLKQAGALVLGKTSMPELALGSPHLQGDPTNPHVPDRMTG